MQTSLLDLPQELLDYIASLAAIELEPTEIYYDDTQDTLHSPSHPYILSPALTCHRLSISYLRAFYTHNTFSFPSGPNNAFAIFHSQLDSAYSTRITSLAFPYHLSEADWTFLQLCTNLRSLSLYFANARWILPNPHDEPMQTCQIEHIAKLPDHFPRLQHVEIDVEKFDFDGYRQPGIGRSWASVEAAVDDVRTRLTERDEEAVVTLRESYTFRSPDSWRRDRGLERSVRWYLGPREHRVEYAWKERGFGWVDGEWTLRRGIT